MRKAALALPICLFLVSTHRVGADVRVEEVEFASQRQTRRQTHSGPLIWGSTT
jgi:hypothetical protein